jgi:hypothetical protein
MRNWGSTAPNLAVVLQTYQREYIKTKTKGATTETAQQDPSNNNGGGGAGGSGSGGGSGGGPPAWEKKVLKDDYGGHYYMDENDEYCACDEKGNQLRMNSSHGPTSNPYGILLVFMDSHQQPYLYARGKHIPCQLQQDKSTRRYFIVDAKRGNRNAQIYGSRGSLPKWRAPRAPAPAQQPAQPSSKTPSSRTPSSKTPSQAAKAPVPRQPLQAVQYMVDASGRRYYIGSDGKAHWAA